MWGKVKKFFLQSETIFLARLMVFLGMLLEAVAAVEPHLFAGYLGQWFPIYLIAHGVLSEYLRRRRDEALKERGL